MPFDLRCVQCTMSGFFQQDLPASTENDIQPQVFYDQSSLLTDPQTLSSVNLNRWFDLETENARPVPKGAARVRRRPPPGSDHVKHRRTRSGCYTCRTRRVKVSCNSIALTSFAPANTGLNYSVMSGTQSVKVCLAFARIKWWLLISFDRV